MMLESLENVDCYYIPEGIYILKYTRVIRGRDMLAVINVVTIVILFKSSLYSPRKTDFNRVSPVHLKAVGG